MRLIYKIAPDINRKYSEYSFAPYLFRPNKHQFTRIPCIGYVLFHDINNMGRYVAATYRLHELYVYMYKYWVDMYLLRILDIQINEYMIR